MYLTKLWINGIIKAKSADKCIAESYAIILKRGAIMEKDVYRKNTAVLPFQPYKYDVLRILAPNKYRIKYEKNEIK